MNVKQKLTHVFIRTKLNLLTIINKKKAGELAFKLFCTPLIKYSGQESEIFKQGEPLQFHMDGKIVKGYRCGHPKPKKILLLHGFSSSCHNFQFYTEQLIQKGYEVLAFDAPAHGASEGITVNAVEYSEMIKKVIELFGPVHGFIAHSFGGMALSLALEQLPHDAHTKVVLIAPATETTSAIDNAFHMLGINNLTLRRSLDEIIYNMNGRETAWYSIRRAVKNIKASILWIHDEDDEVTPLHDALKVKEDAPENIRFLFTKNLGHRKIYRDKKVISEVIQFL